MVIEAIDLYPLTRLENTGKFGFLLGNCGTGLHTEGERLTLQSKKSKTKISNFLVTRFCVAN